MPLVSTQLYGKGSALPRRDETWRWRYNAKRSCTPFGAGGHQIGLPTCGKRRPRAIALERGETVWAAGYVYAHCSPDSTP